MQPFVNLGLGYLQPAHQYIKAGEGGTKSLIGQHSPFGRALTDNVELGAALEVGLCLLAHGHDLHLQTQGGQLSETLLSLQRARTGV